MSGGARRSIEEIAEWASADVCAPSAEELDRLAVYLETLLLWNRSIALVSRQDVGAIATKHFADSLAAAARCRDASSIVDIGSGAGFPGLVMAIVNPASRVTLIESRGKKVSFLREVIRLAGVSNADVLQQRIDAAATREERFDLAISRAFGSLSEFLELARALIREGGVAVAMKGPAYRAEVDSVQPGWTLEATEEYRLPDASKRVLLRYRRA